LILSRFFILYFPKKLWINKPFFAEKFGHFFIPPNFRPTFFKKNLHK